MTKAIAEQQNGQAAPTKVDVLKAEEQALRQTLSLTGTVEARQHAQLATLEAGVVAAMLVEAGDYVAKGDPLLVLDDKLAALTLAQREASLAAAHAALIEAQRLYEEVVTLSKKQLVAETLMAERESGVAIANAEFKRVQAEVAQQQEVVNRHRLYAPFDGVISERHVDLGEWITQQRPAFTLVEQAKLRLKLAIPQEYFSQLSSANLTNRENSVNGQIIGVEVSPDAAPTNIANPPISATLSRIVSDASNTSRTITGYVDLPQAENLVAGMSARADIILPSTRDQLSRLIWLPKTAIKQHPDGGRSVFTVEQNRAKRHLVKVVETQGEQVAVTGAPSNSDFVVTGVALLKDGALLAVNRIKGAKQ
ncbi:efflux RND transporter periplasmic adaptor subunit [Thalassotalea euphylliae]|uniref:Efflux RND transporter periplasmic adaptor subunit n=1 Tax=Thalassotalea euphylliae TaxID=1655234 RepID=A0A3E0UGX2_9GAMM|nr:efflux RND transporter periplasmic adaptor subunit [Thalassotalea euphylliae]REL35002.1 efflux RND transporter periplasmic adaptor subunit [Thalassotalea euphylliae]